MVQQVIRLTAEGRRCFCPVVTAVIVPLVERNQMWTWSKCCYYRAACTWNAAQLAAALNKITTDLRKQQEISPGSELSKKRLGAERTRQCLGLFLLKMPGGHAIRLTGEARAFLCVTFFLFAGFIGKLPSGRLPCGSALRVCAGVCVCSLTLCLDEMEYLCSDMSCIFHILHHEIPIHSFQLPQQHHYLGVTGNAGETRKRHDHLQTVQQAVNESLCICRRNKCWKPKHPVNWVHVLVWSLCSEKRPIPKKVKCCNAK